MDKEHICANCQWYKRDYGVFTATGWTGMDRNKGQCNYEPRPIRKDGKDWCARYTPNMKADAREQSR